MGFNFSKFFKTNNTYALTNTNDDLSRNFQEVVLPLEDYKIIEAKIISGNSKKNLSIFLSLPKDVWKNGICCFLSKKELSRLRLTCSWFRREIVIYPVWKQVCDYDELAQYQKKCSKFGWEQPILHEIRIFFHLTPLSNALLQSLPRTLKSCDFSNCYQFLMNEHLELIPPSLVELNLRNCKKISGKGLQYIPTTLAKINLGFTNISESFFHYLPSSLTCLNLTSCQISIKDIHTLSETLPKLLHLNLSENYVLPSEGLRQLPSQLVKLNLCRFNLADQALMKLPSTLTDLNLNACTNINQTTLQYLPSSLTKLHIKYCSQFSIDCIEYFPISLKQLVITLDQFQYEKYKISPLIKIIENF